MAPKGPRTMSRRRSALVWTLLVLAALLALVSALTVWSREQLLDTDRFTSSSAELLANDDVRAAISQRLVDLLNQRIDLTAQLQEQLPPRAKSAAPVAAAAIQNSAGRVIDAFLATPQAQELWERVTRRAHTAIVRVLEGKDAGPISTANGDVVLDLRPFLQRVAERLGVQDRLNARASPETGEIVILESDQLDAAQTAVKLLHALSSLLSLVVLVLLALAVYLANGNRRRTLQWAGVCLLFVGVLLVVIRRVVGAAIVDSLAKTETQKPAVRAVWLIQTDLLRDIALALLLYGLLALLAGFVAGPSRPAVGLRRSLAPTFRERPVLVYVTALFVFLLLVAWGPTNAPRRLIGTVILAALLAFGLELWRRQTVREFPETVPTPHSDRQLDGLERLARLRSSGALTDSEFEDQKAALLGA
jgi:hypothetical protein